MNAKDVTRALDAVAEKNRIIDLQRFFQTAPGQYAEGDRFIGVRVPNQRAVAKKFRTLPLTEITTLLKSPIHEHRLTALFILVLQFRSADNPRTKKAIVTLYLANRTHINNWDLIDSSAPYILGEYYYDHDRAPIYALVQSKSQWDRRIAVMTTFYWLRQKGDFADTFTMAEQLLTDPEPLIHKAVGWMLREIGKLDYNAERLWLDKHAAAMPRTMLRYAIEKMSPSVRQHYLAMK